MSSESGQVVKSAANPIVDNASWQFAAIATDGEKADLTGGDEYSDTSYSHVQGFARYEGYYLVVQNRHDHAYGKIYFFDADTGALVDSWHLEVGSGSDDADGHDLSYNHPGGIQVIGDYLLVPIQTQNYQHSVVQLWDLTPLRSGSTAITLVDGDFLPDSNDKRIGAIGIVNTGDGFVIAAGNDKTIHIYTAEGTDLEKADFQFSFSGKTKYDSAGACLLTDDSGTIYLVSTGGESFVVSYDDYALLYRIDVANQQIGYVSAKTCMSHSTIGFAGVHFRWGSGIYFREGPRLGLMATQRVMEKSFTINTWQ